MLLQSANPLPHGFLFILLFSSTISTNIHACNQTECSTLKSFSPNMSSHPINWTPLSYFHLEGIHCRPKGLAVISRLAFNRGFDTSKGGIWELDFKNASFFNVDLRFGGAPQYITLLDFKSLFEL